MKSTLLSFSAASLLIVTSMHPVTAAQTEVLYPPQQSEAPPSQTEKPVKDDTEQNDYPRLLHLEKVITGETFAGEKLPARLSRLEEVAFGQRSKTSDFCQRTDRLEQYIKETMEEPTLNDVTAEDAVLKAEIAMEQPKKRKINKKILITAIVITLVLGAIVLTGGAGAGPAAAMGASGMGAMGAMGGGMGMAGPMAMGGGMGMGGAAPSLLSNLAPMALTAGMSSIKMIGMASMGMGLMGKGTKGPRIKFLKKGKEERFKPHRDAPEAENYQAETKLAGTVIPASPSAENSTLVNKVRWCETQLFGKTFDSMRMVDRLTQLSQQIVAESDSNKDFKASIDTTLNAIKGFQGNN